MEGEKLNGAGMGGGCRLPEANVIYPCRQSYGDRVRARISTTSRKSQRNEEKGESDVGI